MINHHPASDDMSGAGLLLCLKLLDQGTKGLIREAIAQENSGQIGVFFLDTKNKAAAKVASSVQFAGQPTKASASAIMLHKITEKVNLKMDARLEQERTARMDAFIEKLG